MLTCDPAALLASRSTSMAGPASAAAGQDRDWSALPPGVWQRIFRKASTSQAPGVCLCMCVCRRWWHTAAAPCSGIHILYQTGQPLSDSSFARWLARRGHQLAALTLNYNKRYSAVMDALMAAAGAAAAAGRPLPLHTLRVLGDALPLHFTVHLLAALPNLRCLQLEVWRLEGTAPSTYVYLTVQHLTAKYQQPLGALQAASQLEELYLTGPVDGDYGHRLAMAPLLPASLKRLSWTPGAGRCVVPPLQHLTQLTFLQLSDWHSYELSGKLPPSLQQLEVVKRGSTPVVEVPPEQWRQAVAAFGDCATSHREVLPTLFNLHTASVTAAELGYACMGTALQQLSSLSTLKVHVEVDPPLPAAAAAAGGAGGGEQVLCRHPRSLQGLLAVAPRLSSLQCLHLGLHNRHLPDPTGLAALTGLQQLTVTSQYACNVEQQRVWGREISRMAGLRWLSVPDVLLEAEQDWLGGLQQLRVLSLHVVPHWSEPLRMAAFNVLRMQWVAGCSPAALPLRLRVLGWSGMTAAQAAVWGLRGRLQQRVGSTGCEVVVGVDLDRLADPAQRLAGLPLELQQALA